MTYNYDDWIRVLSTDIDGLHINEDFISIIKNTIDKFNLVKSIEKGSILYRARIIEDINDLKSDNIKFWGYDETGSFVPPVDKIIKDGRLNFNHHQILYMATDSYTAITETRPGKRNQISVAQIEVKEKVSLVDFNYKFDNSCNSAHHWICFEFYKCVNDKNYKITQQIGKCIQNLGYDGISYSSSLSESGKNVALFDFNKAKPVSSKLYQATSVLYVVEEQLPRDLVSNGESNYRLLPKSITDKFKDNEIEWFFNEMKNKKRS